MTRERRPISLVIGALVATVAGTLATLAVTAAPAGATVFSNPATITVNDASCSGTPGVASPYPSSIAVAGLSGTVSDVNVTLSGVTHPFEGDLEILLVGPGGGSQNLELLSDAGTGALSNATVTFDDSAAAQAPQNSAWGPGTYKPTNYTELGPADSFPAPAPAPSATTTLATAFNGIVPNGTWSLYVVDDACPDGGSIASGWSLDITTVSGAATTTSVGSTPNPSTTGTLVTFTATVMSGGSPVTTGTVTFTEGPTTLAANVAVNGSGQASFTKSNLPEGDHLITATYNGVPAFNTSNGSVNQRVDNATTVTGTSYCNTGAITLPSVGTATPYPSNIFITGAPTNVVKVTATLKNVSHAFDGDIEALLVGPASQNLEIVSDAGTAGITNVTVNLDDAAAGSLPVSGSWAAANSTITVKPTNYNELTPDNFPAPAPAPSVATTLATFNGTDPNGTWSLYVVDDAAPDSGSIAGGWCLNFTFDTTPPTVSIVQAAGQADPTQHSPINFTATFSEPVTGFTSAPGDVVFTASTAGGTLLTNVTGGPTIYNVAVTGMTTAGTVVASIPAGVATDLAGNPNVASAGGDNSVTWQVDTTLPTCAITALIVGPPKQMQVTVQDTGSGLQSITNVQIVNGTVATNPSPIPAGTTAPVVVTATKTDQSMSTVWSFDAVDVAGNVKHCA